MSEVIAEVTGAGPERIAVVSGPNLATEIARREPAASVVACADEDGGARRLQDAHPLAGVPSLHEHRRARLRARRRLQERRRPRGRHGRRPRLRRQHHGVGDHPRPGRDRPAGDRAGRQPAHPDGAGRPRRPGRHLLLAALAQPHLRREARPGDDHRGDLRLDPAGRRGRQVLLLAAGAGRAAPASTRRSPSTSTRSSPAG